MKPLSLLRFFIPSVFSLLALGARPEWEITLAEMGDQFRPALAQLVGRQIYFSFSTGKKDCLGRDLYRFTLDAGKRSPEQVAKVSCIAEMSSQDGILLVRARSSQAGQGIESYFFDEKNNSLQSVSVLKDTTGQRESSQARVSWANAYLKLESSPQAPSLAYGKYLYFAWEGKSGVWLDPFSWQRSEAKLKSPVFLPSADDLTHAVASQDGRSLFVVKSVGDWTRIEEHRVLEPYPHSSTLTSESPLRLQNEWNSGDFSIRLASFYGGCESGLFVYEGSRHPEALNGLYQFDSKKKIFTTIEIPSLKDVAGVSYAKGGYLVSRPGERKIQWYGDRRDAFQEGVDFAPSDIRKKFCWGCASGDRPTNGDKGVEQCG